MKLKVGKDHGGEPRIEDKQSMRGGTADRKGNPRRTPPVSTDSLLFVLLALINPTSTCY